MYESRTDEPLPRGRFAARLGLHLGLALLLLALSLAGKLFAGTYALYAGLVFIVATALVLTPVIHRVLHRFHADADDGPDDPPAA